MDKGKCGFSFKRKIYKEMKHNINGKTFDDILNSYMNESTNN